jgi:Gpi18-like mannosyltransferase
VEHYVTIAERGYSPSDGTLSFHPLYPVLGRLAATTLGTHVLGGLFIVSSAASLLFLLTLERLARFDLEHAAAFRACLFFLLLPSAYILFAPYTEPLFLLCSAMSLLKAREQRWWSAGLWGGLAALTRQQGVLLLLPLLWELWEASARDWRTIIVRWRAGLGVLLAPVGLVVWLLFRSLTLSDASFEWTNPYTLVYGLVISPSAAQIIATQRITFPWVAIWTAIANVSVTNAIDLAAGGVYVFVLVVCGRTLWQLRPSYFIYSLVTLLVSFALSTGVPYAYMGLARHCLLAFPLSFALAATPPRSPILRVVQTVGVVSLLLLPVFYVWKLAWVP